MGGSIKIGNRNYSWAELSRPEIRRAVLPMVEKMISDFKRNPELREAQGFSVLDLQTAIRWQNGHLRQRARRSDAHLC